MIQFCQCLNAILLFKKNNHSILRQIQHGGLLVYCSYWFVDLRFASDPYCLVYTFSRVLLKHLWAGILKRHAPPPHCHLRVQSLPGTACLHMEQFAGSDFYCGASFGDGNDTWIAIIGCQKLHPSNLWSIPQFVFRLMVPSRRRRATMSVLYSEIRITGIPANSWDQVGTSWTAFFFPGKVISILSNGARFLSSTESKKAWCSQATTSVKQDRVRSWEYFCIPLRSCFFEAFVDVSYQVQRHGFHFSSWNNSL